jgi:hypothetical protein
MVALWKNLGKSRKPKAGYRGSRTTHLLAIRVVELLTCVSWILAAISHWDLRFICKVIFPLLADIKYCTVFVSYSARTVAELVVEHWTSSFSTSMDNQIRISRCQRTHYCTSVPIHGRGEALAFELAHLSLSSELYLYTRVSVQLNFHTAMRFP